MNYTVRPGDTFSSIAKRFLGDARKFPLLLAVNPGSDPNSLQVGTELLIPPLNGGAPPAIPASFAHVTSGTAILNEQRLAKVHPAVATRARAMVELLAQSGVEILITQGLRTWEEQDALYAKGRTTPPTGPKFIVTKAKGGQSYHNFGLAVDIVVLDAIGKADWDTSHPGWKAAATAGKSLGLEWGGDWKSFKDLPHFQYTAGFSLRECGELYAEGGIPAVWAEMA